MSETRGDIADEIGEILNLSERPTVHLRFNGGTLEQMIEVTEYSGGSPISIDRVWRPVPQAPHD